MTVRAAERRGGTAIGGTRAWARLARVATYAILLVWAFVSLFPILWTITTSFKSQVAVIKGPTYILAGLRSGRSRLALDSAGEPG